MAALDVIFLRRPKLEYVCPALCDYNFASADVSSYASTIVALSVLPGPSGVKIVAGVLSWDAYPGALCYTVYRANDVNSPYSVIADCHSDAPLAVGAGVYRVSAITLEGESELSEPIQH